MGSSIEALVARQAGVLDAVAEDLGSLLCRLPQGFMLVPVPEAATPDDWRDAYDHFTYLSPQLAERARAMSATSPIAYIESSTFAGDAVQRAVIWRDGQVAWGPRHTCNLEQDAKGELVWAKELHDEAVNAALRELGVQRGDAIDEYAALGLDARRSTEEWLS